MQWSERIGHALGRRVRKFQGFFRFYGGKLRDLWQGSGGFGRKLVNRTALVGGFAGVAVLALLSWSTLSRLSGLQPGETLIVAPAVDGGASLTAVEADPGEPSDDIRVTITPYRPAVPEVWRPPIGIEALIRPVVATTTSAPGWRREPRTGHWYYESALQMQAPAGSVVQAALPGTVAAVDLMSEGGMRIALQHDGGIRTVYENLHDVTVAVGHTVSGYAPLGRLAASDTSDGQPSLMFAVYKEDEAVDVSALFDHD